MTSRANGAALSAPAVHFARVIPATPGARGRAGRVRTLALCAAIDDLQTTSDQHAVTCRRCLARLADLMGAEPASLEVPLWREIESDDYRGDYERDLAIDGALTGDA